jgi:hypothetical protein
MGKKAYDQDRAGTPFVKIFPKFEFWGINGYKAHENMWRAVSPNSAVMRQ